ncbi:uncharacterized protein LOC143905796 [Temnothorax americanus]|uniref:uncharacterized protein LOC143905796 n=1 Tax=Temnothorax americanus TaxID=1964332 RepID=UPI004068C504
MQSAYFRQDIDSDSEELDLPFLIPEEVNLETKEPRGGIKLRFTQKELHLIKHTSTSQDNRCKAYDLVFFGALLNKCATQGRRRVCAFTLRMNTRTTFCHMIPNAELGSFSLSRRALENLFELWTKNLVFRRSHGDVTSNVRTNVSFCLLYLIFCCLKLLSKYHCHFQLE